MSLFQSYEQEFASVQADIVRKIGVVPELAGDEKQREIKSAEKDIDDAKELVRMLLSGPVRNSASVCVYPLHHTFAHKSTMRTQITTPPVVHFSA